MGINTSYLKGIGASFPGSNGSANANTISGGLQQTNNQNATDKAIADGSLSKSEVDSFLSDSKNGASSLMAAISRLEWKDFQERYAPVMRDFSQQVMSGDTVTDAVNDARNSTIQGFANAQKNQQTADSRLGLSLNSGVLETRERSNNLAAAAAQATAVNDARVSAKDRENIILSGGAGAGLRTGG